MKKLLFIILSICFSLSVSAQKIHFTDTSNVWKDVENSYNDNLPPIFTYYTFSFKNYTIIDSVAYTDFGFGLVREDTILSKVFFRDTVGDSDIVMMDYNLAIGDTFTTIYNPFTSSNYNQFVVNGIDSTLINGLWYKVWYFNSNYWGIIDMCIIEGIGCIQYPTYMLFNSDCVECSGYQLFCFSNDGNTPLISPAVVWLNNSTSCTSFLNLRTSQVQTKINTIAISPNPTYDYFTITSTNTITQLIITNLLGQTIISQQPNMESTQIDVSNLAAGVYFVRVNNTEVRKFVKE